MSRRYSFSLRTGHKAAHLCTESAMHHYVGGVDVPKEWFKANVDIIMQIYSAQHRVQREDLLLGSRSLHSTS